MSIAAAKKELQPRSDYVRLRTSFDHSETFMKGHTKRGPRTKSKRVPDWMYYKEEIRRFLMCTFPKMFEQGPVAERQRQLAGLWALVIQEYYLGQRSEMDIEYSFWKSLVSAGFGLTADTTRLLRQHDFEDVGVVRVVKRSSVGDIARKILRVSRGMRTDGTIKKRPCTPAPELTDIVRREAMAA